MNHVLNGNPYAVLDKQVGYKEALEEANNLLDRKPAIPFIAVLFNVSEETVRRDLDRVDLGQCIACGDIKTIERKHWNPINSQWEPHAVDCQECEEVPE